MLEQNTTIATITPSLIEGEPRVRDIDLGERLGFERPRVIRELIERNKAEVESFGLAPRRTAPITSGKGRVTEVQEYWLNEEQALLVATISNAPKAPQVRAMLIRVFVAWRRGELPSPRGGAPKLNPATFPPVERHYWTDGSLRHAVRAYDVYSYLDARRTFISWIRERVAKSNLIEGEDFIVQRVTGESGWARSEYILTISAARAIAACSGCSKGRDFVWHLINLAHPDEPAPDRLEQLEGDMRRVQDALAALGQFLITQSGGRVA